MVTEKILFVGLNTIDLQFLVERYPESNTKTKALQNEVCVGGPATNAAITCSFLGSKTDLISPVGTHEFSKYICSEITNSDIHLIDPLVGQNSNPVFASIITSQMDGERTVFSYHPEAFSVDDKKFEIDVNNYKLVLFDGFYTRLTLPLAQRFQEKGITTVYDGGSWKKDTDLLLKYIDIAICSEDFRVPGGSTAQEIFRYLHNLGVKDAAITRGDNNILCSHKDGEEELDIERIDAVDTLGAGDIFHGAFCHYYSNGHNFINSLQRASVVAGESCKWFGTREWMKYY